MRILLEQEPVVALQGHVRADLERVPEHGGNQIAAGNAQHGEIRIRIVAGQHAAEAAPVEQGDVTAPPLRLMAGQLIEPFQAQTLTLT